MANQDFNLTGAIKVRSAEEDDATYLQAYCFPESTREQVAEELKTDLETGSGVHRLVAEASGYPIGQVTVMQDAADPEAARVSNLAVAGPFRQLGVADHLMDAAADTAAANGVKSLEIELAPSETSVIQRYKAWGFTEKPIVVLQKMLDAAPSEEEIKVEVDDTNEDAEDEVLETGDEQPSLLDA
jgi:ribosomal protein S18 acetylase RimI-like enzyme